MVRGTNYCGGWEFISIRIPTILESGPTGWAYIELAPVATMNICILLGSLKLLLLCSFNLPHSQ